MDAFVAGFSPAGSLLFCTYLGGSGDDRAFGVTVDSANNTYVTGYTSSTNFPLANPFQTRLGGTRDAFVAKLNPAGMPAFQHLSGRVRRRYRTRSPST